MRSIPRQKTPTMLQMEATECGAAALGIILGFHGLFLPMETLRIQCGVSRDGSNALNIIKAARLYGLRSFGIKAELSDLEASHFPLIAFWRFNHFVVIEGYNKKYVYINDPASGPLKISHKEFDEAYTGVGIFCQPDTEFRPSGKPISLGKSLLSRVKADKANIVFITLLSMLLVLPGFLLSGMAKIYIDNILIGGKGGWIVPFLGALILVYIMQMIIVGLQRHYLLRLKIKFILAASSKLVWHLLHLSMAFFQQRFAGDIYHRVIANDRIAQILSTEISAALAGLVSMIFFALILLLLSWPLALIGLLTELLVVTLYITILRKIGDKSIQGAQNTGKLIGYQMAVLQIIDRIKTSSSEDNVFDRWASQHADVLNNQRKLAYYQQIIQIGPQFLHALSSIIIIIVGSLLVMKGHISIGTLVAIQILLAQFSSPVQILLNAGFDLQKIRADFIRVDDVLNQHVEEKKTDGSFLDLQGVISIKEVSFSYSPLDLPLLKNINLDIMPGEKIAIIGATGCGKSTLLKVLTGLYAPSTGSVLFNKISIDTIPSQQLAQHLSVVEQDILLFSGSIRDNLSLWRPAITEEVMIAALQLVELWDDILPRDGLDCIVLEGGSNFSQGQKQRLEIARALCIESKVLILDESTSGLNQDMESRILKRLFNKSITIILITHRLTVIKPCDRIVLMNNGAINAIGTHAHLLQESEIYRQLMELE